MEAIPTRSAKLDIVDEDLSIHRHKMSKGRTRNRLSLFRMIDVRNQISPNESRTQTVADNDMRDTRLAKLSTSSGLSPSFRQSQSKHSNVESQDQEHDR